MFSKGLFFQRLWGPKTSWVLAIASSLLIADQLTKYWVLQSPNLVAGGKHIVTPFFDLVLVWNRGISYGLFQQNSMLGSWVLAGVGLLIVGFVWLWAANKNSLLTAVTAALLIGGGLGNIIDRLLHGAVVDFISLHAFGFYWYIFNLADMAIVAAFLFLLYDMVVTKSD